MGRKSIKKCNRRKKILTKKFKQKGGVPSIRNQNFQKPVDFDLLEKEILYNNLENCVEILEKLEDGVKIKLLNKSFTYQGNSLLQ